MQPWAGASSSRWHLAVAVTLACFVLLLGGRITASSNQIPLQGHPVQFSEVTQSAGITFVHLKGNNGTPTILEETGPGVCVSDYDGDGYPDIYFVNGRDLYHRGIEARNALYHNNRDGMFTDVTDRAGVPGTAYGLGCAWGDYDDDGFPDLYVTQYGKNVLYRNNGDGTFTDVTEKAGVGCHRAWNDLSQRGYFLRLRPRWPTGPLRGRLCQLPSGQPTSLRYRARSDEPLLADGISGQLRRALPQQRRWHFHGRYSRREDIPAQRL